MLLKTLISRVDGENDAIWKRWRHQNRHDRAPDHSTVSIQNGGQTLPCGFNFAPISPADILKCACVEFIWACALRAQKRFQNGYSVVVWTDENDTCGRKSFWKRSKTAPISFANGLVWMRPLLQTPNDRPMVLRYNEIWPSIHYPPLGWGVATPVAGLTMFYTISKIISKCLLCLNGIAFSKVNYSVLPYL